MGRVRRVSARQTRARSRSGFQPQQDKYNGGVDGYLAIIAETKKMEQVLSLSTMSGRCEWKTMRMEYVDPLTRASCYIDPIPVAAAYPGDVFGHPDAK